jgi:GNAT superfamily N-acetyltransferase
MAEYVVESAIPGMPPPTLDRGAYHLLERTGAATMLSATEGEALLGFLHLLVYRNPHYSAQLAVVESYFVAKEHRSTGAGLALRREAERVASELGAVGMIIVAPVGGQLARVLSKIPEYAASNTAFFRKLA